MFERMTDRTRNVMAIANREAIRYNHSAIATEHILLALVIEGAGIAAHVLKNLGADLPTLRRELEESIATGGTSVVNEKLPLTNEANQLIADAKEEARSLDHNYIGTEHILLGFLHQPGSVAANSLTKLGVSQDQLRKGVLKLLGAAPE